MIGHQQAAAIEAKYAEQRGSLRHRRELAPVVDAATIASLAATAFWTSLRREEGRTPKLSLAYLPPEAAEGAFRFDRPLAMDPDVLIRLGPAVERSGIHVGVWRGDDGYVAWGIVRELPDVCVVLEVFEPGLLAFKYSRDEVLGKFGNVAVLNGDEVNIVDESFTERPSCPSVLTSLVSFDPGRLWHSEGSVFVRLAASMRAHGHGGILLVVPTGDDAWRDSIAWPAPYAAVPAFTRLADVTPRSLLAERDHERELALLRAIDAVAGFTAVDGATVLDRHHDVLAFGAMITPVTKGRTVERVRLTEPVRGNVSAIVEVGAVGNARHRSAAQFVQDQHDALALVASQDGRFTAFAWSEPDHLVHAYRIDALLL